MFLNCLPTNCSDTEDEKEGQLTVKSVNIYTRLAVLQFHYYKQTICVCLMVNVKGTLLNTFAMKYSKCNALRGQIRLKAEVFWQIVPTGRGVTWCLLSWFIVSCR